MDRAYSLVMIKSIDEDRRIIAGIATTPTPDRLGDIVDPYGVKVASDIPLFLYHDSKKTVGRARLGKATKGGIPFEASLPHVKEEGALKDRIDEAWQMLKYRLITGVSIGFNVLNEAYEAIKGGGIRYLETEVLELSLVPIPAQQEAVIQTVKSIDTQSRAAIGRNAVCADTRPGASGQAASRGDSTTQRQKGKDIMKTIQELREARAQKAARLAELKDLWVAEDRASSETEAEEFDSLTDEVKSLDDDIRKMRFDQLNASTAKAVDGRNTEAASQSRGPTIIVRNSDPDDKFKGQSYVRGLIAKALAMQYGESPAAIAKQRWGQTHPQLVNVIRATVAGGGTGSGEWGAELAQLDARYTGDFTEYLYAKTVFDQLGLREVPARVRVKGQDGAFTANWVGESKGIPMSRGDYSAVDLDPLKVAALTVISMELLEDSQPAAEMLVRDGLVEACSQKVDTTFLSAVAASAGVSPAGILNGVGAISPSGVDLAAVRADLQSLMYPFVAAKMGSGIKLVMNPSTALAISMMYGALDQPAFPDINESGGTLGRRPVIVGDNVTPGDIIAIRTDDVWRIGDSGVRISMSREATIEQRDDPSGATDTPTGVNATGLTNMFQEESVAFKVVRRINFQKRRTAAVQYISSAEYGGVVS